MRAGLAFAPDGRTWTWLWCDPTCPCPFEIPAEVGLRIVDLSALAPEEAHSFLDMFLQRKLNQAFFLTYFPVITPPVPLTPALPQGWVGCIQVGYQRICHRPSEGWLAQELAARAKTNARTAAGEPVARVIDEEFTHLDSTERATRKGMARSQIGHTAVLFPLTPIVRLVELKRKQADGTEKVETLRQFPYHKLIAEF